MRPPGPVKLCTPVRYRVSVSVLAGAHICPRAHAHMGRRRVAHPTSLACRTVWLPRPRFNACDRHAHRTIISTCPCPCGGPAVCHVMSRRRLLGECFVLTAPAPPHAYLSAASHGQHIVHYRHVTRACVLTLQVPSQGTPRTGGCSTQRTRWAGGWLFNGWLVGHLHALAACMPDKPCGWGTAACSTPDRRVERGITHPWSARHVWHALSLTECGIGCLVCKFGTPLLLHVRHSLSSVPLGSLPRTHSYCPWRHHTWPPSCVRPGKRPTILSQSTPLLSMVLALTRHGHAPQVWLSGLTDFFPRGASQPWNQSYDKARAIFSNPVMVAAIKSQHAMLYADSGREVRGRGGETAKRQSNCTVNGGGSADVGPEHVIRCRVKGRKI